MYVPVMVRAAVGQSSLRARRLNMLRNFIVTVGTTVCSRSGRKTDHPLSNTNKYATRQGGGNGLPDFNRRAFSVVR